MKRDSQENLRRQDPYQVYEAMKRSWLAEHPEATHKQYEQAIRAIAKKLGV